jgi:Carboxypeptidase regulatory-like domain
MSSPRRRRYSFIFFFPSLPLLLAVSCCWQPISAQTINATLTGNVTDAAGAAITGAVLTITNTATGTVRTAQTDAVGRYQATSLQPGPYEVKTEMSGFATKTLTGITLNVGDVQQLEIALAVGGTSDTIQVDAGESLIQTQTSSNGTLVDNKQVVELPLANRQFYNLALLSPAAYQPAQNSTLGFRGGINIAGVTEIGNQFTVNGIYDNDMGVAQPSFRPSVEVIQEFRLLTGVYPAEYGRMPGGQVVIITKSGSNTFHGSAYEFIRNEFTDAKPFFTAANAKTPSFKQNTFGTTIGGPIIKDKTFFFFGYEGQRIRQAVTAQATVPTTDMLNGIFSTGKKLYNPATGLDLNGNSGSTNYNLANLLSGTNKYQWGSAAAAAGQAIAKLGFPAPTYSTASGSAPSNNYAFQETRIENMNEFTARVDHTISPKDSIFGSFNLFKDPAFEPSNSLCSSYVIPKFGCYTNQISTLMNVTYNRILTTNLLNEVRLGFQRLQQPRTQEDNTAVGSTYSGLPGGPYFTQVGYANNLGLPNTSVSGYATIGGATNLPQNRWDNHYQIVDVLTWNHGAHSIKTGVDLFLARSTNLITSSGRGAFSVNDASIKAVNGGSTQYSTGDSMADLLLGLTYTSTIGTTAPMVYMNFQSYHLFVQDDWKILPSLTINAGMRWELDEPVYSPHDTVSRFDTNTQVFQAASSNGFTHLYNFDYNNFAPRLGFSWRPFNSDSTVIKGATGIFYNTPLLYNQFLNTGTQYPFRLVTTYTSSARNTISLDNPFPASQAGSPCLTKYATGSSLPCSSVLSSLAISPNYRTPYWTEWSLGIERSIGKNLVFETTYFASKGTRLPLSVSLNEINPATFSLRTGTTAPAQIDRPFPGYSTVTYQNTSGNSEFQSWQNSLKKAYSNGTTFMLAYTWGRSIDGGSGIGSGSNSSGTPQNVYNLRADRGLSDFNVAHRVVFSPVAELPFGRNKKWLNSGLGSKLAGGWQVSGILSWQTGRPFTITSQSSNNSGYFGQADRPNSIGNPNASVDSVTGAKTHTVAEWFNVHAFQSGDSFRVANGVQHYGQYGNTHRNTVIGPQYADLDLTLSRNFPIYEHFNGQFRAESFNLFNHPNFYNPLTTGLQFPGTGATPTLCGGSLTSGCAAVGSFGSLTQANNPRDLQFSLRILY